MARTIVTIMAKMPQAGMVKTRLCPPLSPAQATTLYESFLRDKVAQVSALQAATPALAYTPAHSRDFFTTLAADFMLLPQQGDDLTARLLSMFATLFGLGYTGVIATDSDSPTLPLQFLQQAVDLLANPEVDVVLGPSADGGYYLIGLRQVYPVLFEDMPWSTSVVCAETLRRAESAGLRVVCLPSWFDIDTAADLERLRQQMAEMGEAAPRYTRQFFSTYIFMSQL